MFYISLKRPKQLITFKKKEKRDQKRQKKRWRLEKKVQMEDGKLWLCKTHKSRFIDMKVCTIHACIYSVRGEVAMTNFPCLRRMHNRKLNFQAIFFVYSYTTKFPCRYITTLGNGKSKQQKRMLGNKVIKLLKVDFFFVDFPPSGSFSALSFSHKNLIIFHNKHEHVTVFYLISMSVFSRCSDCEVNDVVEIAKDEKMTERLYAETLRVLKLDKI